MGLRIPHHNGRLFFVCDHAQDLDHDDEEVPDDDEVRERGRSASHSSTAGSICEAYVYEGEQLKEQPVLVSVDQRKREK